MRDDTRTDDTRTAANITRVCKTWHLEGANLVWRNIMLRDLLNHIDVPARVVGFARHVERIHFLPADGVLADPRIASLDFPKLQTIEINRNNLPKATKQACIDSLKALITPTLRSWILKENIFADVYVQAIDGDIWLRLLWERCDQLTIFEIRSNLNFDAQLLWNFLRDTVHLEGLVLAQSITEWLTDDHMVLILGKPNLRSLNIHPIYEVTPATMDRLFHILGHSWMMPKLRNLQLTFDLGAGRTAARLLAVVPNIETVTICLVDGVQGVWNDALDLQVFTALGMSKSLTEIALYPRIGWRLDGVNLLELIRLEHLESLAIVMQWDEPDVRPVPVVTVTGEQWTAFLTGLPKLDSLRLDMGAFHVLATHEEMVTIDKALARIQRVDLTGITLVCSETIESGSS